MEERKKLVVISKKLITFAETSTAVAQIVVYVLAL